MFLRILVALALITGASSVNATLIDRGSGMIYDDILDITWLQDANLDGTKTWIAAAAWADGLSFGGFEDWRLPSMDVNGDGMIVVCTFVNEAACQDNELGYMRQYNLGGIGNLSGNHPPFTNIQGFHWSSTVYGSNAHFLYDFGNGGHNWGFDNHHNWGSWAVRNGDVDSDADGVPDIVDNCLLAINLDQRDADADGIGNICDPDVAVPNDCVVNFLDLNVYRANFFQAGDLDTDNNGDGQTNFLDLNVVRSFFFDQPGPSAHGCN